MKRYPHSPGWTLPPVRMLWLSRFSLSLILFSLFLLWLVACQPKKTAEVTRVSATTNGIEEVALVVTAIVEVEGEAVVAEEFEISNEPTAELLSLAYDVGEEPAAEPFDGGETGNGGPIASNDPSTLQTQERLIIKDGDMTITVGDTDAAAQTAINLTVDYGGYVIEQHIWTSQQEYRHADLRVAVPVDEFENLMDAFRTLGIVIDESATGQDVTDQYVDLNSHLGNLYATQEQLRTFLAQTTNTEEALDVYEELAQVEEEINLIQGQINYLADRAAFSTISLFLEPIIPTATPRPTSTPRPTRTPTPTATATSVPTPDEWRPADTAGTALVELQNSAQDSADFIIYNVILCGPGTLAAAILAFIIWQVVRRVQRRRVWEQSTTPTDNTTPTPTDSTDEPARS